MRDDQHIADAYRNWLNGTAKYSVFRDYENLSKHDAVKLMNIDGLSSRAVSAILRAFKEHQTINFRMLSINPDEVHVRRLCETHNCGKGTLSQIVKWCKSTGLELHPLHLTTNMKDWV